MAEEWDEPVSSVWVGKLRFESNVIWLSFVYRGFLAITLCSTDFSELWSLNDYLGWIVGVLSEV